MNFTPDVIDKLEDNEIFVFGSNTQGRHSRGAALIARKKFGAIYGQSMGRQGSSWAIITKDLTKPYNQQLKSISLEEIHAQIIELYNYAVQNKNLTFYVTKIGTNLAGWSIPEIAEQFRNHKYIPPNIIFPKEFAKYIWKNSLLELINCKTGYHSAKMDILDFINSHRRPLDKGGSYYRISVEDIVKYIEKMEL